MLAASQTAGVQRIVRAHAQRGISLQLWIRGVLAVFVVGTLLLLPPDTGATLCYAIAGGYLLAVLILTGWLSRRGRAAIEWGWLGSVRRPDRAVRAVPGDGRVGGAELDVLCAAERLFSASGPGVDPAALGGVRRAWSCPP